MAISMLVPMDRTNAKTLTDGFGANTYRYMALGLARRLHLELFRYDLRLQTWNLPGRHNLFKRIHRSRLPVHLRISEKKGEAVSGQKPKSDPQAGTSDIKKGRTEIGNTQQTFSVSVDHDMTGAAVAAVFESRCRTFNVQRHMFLCSKGMSGIN